MSTDMCIGHRSLCANQDAMIMECDSPHALAKVWKLCSKAVVLSSDEVIILADATDDAWRELLDQAMKEDEPNAIARIRQKASKGGRVWVTPTATLTAMAASRRRRRAGKPANAMYYLTDVRTAGKVAARTPRLSKSSWRTSATSRA